MLRHAWHPKLVTDLILHVLIIVLYSLIRFFYNTQSQTNEMVNANRWVWHRAFQPPGNGLEFFISQLAVDNEQFQYITIKSVGASLAQGVSANCTLRNITVKKRFYKIPTPVSIRKEHLWVFSREYSTEVPPSDGILLAVKSIGF